MSSFGSAIFRFIRRHYSWLVPLIVFDVWLFRWLVSEPAESMAPVAEGVELVVAIPEKPLLRLVYPTDQTNLWDTSSTEVYMPTASGRIESALYGSTRTRLSGNRILPSFHEGIDIAPMRRGRGNHALDEVHAVADGRVAYLNRVAGNSNYGLYVVLAHDDPVGEVYTLYAHLARVTAGLRAGQEVVAGEVIGIMGHTASTGIPVARAHLHLEIGMIMNQRFNQWYQAQERKPDHGNYHGHNLRGVDPLAAFGQRGSLPPFSMKRYLSEVEPAFVLVYRAERLPDYFQRYPDLWHGPSFRAGGVVLEVSEGGVPVRGRQATVAESEGVRLARVLDVNEDVLDRNGLRLVTRRSGEWELGPSGREWLDILIY
jgi:murein DD-endopeptidase MepM/ murein hydrolase activator NlpD